MQEPLIGPAVKGKAALFGGLKLSREAPSPSSAYIAEWWPREGVPEERGLQASEATVAENRGMWRGFPRPSSGL